MKTILNITLLLIIISTTAFTQTIDIKSLTLEAKQQLTNGDILHNEEMLKKSLANFERILSAEPNNLNAQYFSSYAEYKLALFYRSKNDTQFNEHIKNSSNRLDKLIEAAPNWSEPKSLSSLIYGVRITKNWTMAPTLGPKAMRLAKQAVEIDSTNPRAWMMLGIIKLNTPSFFGGDTDFALSAFQKSDSLFNIAVASDSLAPDWGRLDIYAWLGQYYYKEKKYEEARKVYIKALEIEPNYAWIKNNLLPQLEKAIQKSK